MSGSASVEKNPAISMQPPFSALEAELPEHACPLRLAITAAYRLPEPQAVQSLQMQLPPGAASQPAIAELACQLVASVRAKRKRGFGINTLMHEFSLSSEEGVALMCLAEALLRIPDVATADCLIADKISKGDWRSHLRDSSSLFVNAAAWSLLITGKLVKPGNEAGLNAGLMRMLAKGGEPLIRKGADLAMRLLGEQFVAGQTIEAAIAHSRANEARGYRYSYDMLGEAALTQWDAENYYVSYESAIHAIGQASNGRGLRQGPGISIKLSALHPHYARAQRSRVLQELLPRLARLARLAKRYGIGLTIDAEEADRLELSLDLLEALAFDPALDGYDGIGFAVQAYQKRSPYVIDFLADLANRSHRRFMVRLVKGAYWDSEIKRAQVDGLSDYPVYTRKAHTDMSYLICARKLLAAAASIYPQFATHNAHSVAAIHTWAQQLGIDDYEFQCLHGMGETLYDEVVGSTGLNRPCRIYAPVGSHQTLLAYLVRRLLENGANTSFVNQIVDERIPVETLIADPFATAQSLNGAPHPHIPLPLHLFGPARANSAGVDLSDESVLRELSAQLRAGIGRHWRAAPIIAGPVRAITSQPVINPADARDIVGHVIEAVTEDVDTALAAAQDFAVSWQNVPPSQRAAILLRAADLFEAYRTELLGLAVREAGKSLPNAVAEVREAVDFLRYYAIQVRAMPATIALGAVACISPWNFPLSIFTGQIGAALAAGNAVLAKPAEQTPLIAQRAVELMHEAGVPCAALQLLPGSGETIGARLVTDARIKGVIFTGSTEVALSINRTLAQRSVNEGGEIPFIAETGGQNAMIVDSSALTEQVVQDVLSSAFDSAGQRCSALRVLCLQEEIADRTLQMLRGAMQELCIGNPDRLSVDIGPVIDGRAQQSLLAHIEYMKPKAKTCFQLPLPATAACGTFIAPTLLEIGTLSELKHEVFGPVLHVLRYRREALPQLIDAIHATGYGLTLGVHTRLDESIDYVTTHAHVGNIYVNRNIIGAVVGVQPFGGEGKSGTGPKAGGPLYLHRLLRDSDMSTVRLSVSAAGKSQHRLPAQSLSASSWHAWKNWIASQGDSCLARLATDYENNSLAGITLALPGPTGESNSLRFMPRGAVWCAAASTAVLLNQLAAVAACGNRAIVDPQTATLIPENFPDALLPSIAHPNQFQALAIHLVLVDKKLDVRMRQLLSKSIDVIVPLVETTAEQPIPLWRLVVERTVCINSSAAGGNASLISLREK